MIDSKMDVGPFTPQEFDEVCGKLTSIGVPFELLKDEETEKMEMASDYANLVNKVEYRTEAYLGQIFYLKLAVTDFEKNKALFAEYGMATAPKESPAELQAEGPAEVKEVHEEALAKKEVQRWVARLLVVTMIVALLYGIKSTFLD